jgi:5-carboxymethyl-2-hydroxymuconate isomerase
MNVGKGRELSIRQQAGEALFDTLKAYLEPLMKRRLISLSFEMREIDDVKFNDRNF